jgi:hypothetical protein
MGILGITGTVRHIHRAAEQLYYSEIKWFHTEF